MQGTGKGALAMLLGKVRLCLPFLLRLPPLLPSLLPVPVQTVWPPASPRFLQHPPQSSDPKPNPQFMPLCPRAFA